MFEEVKVVVFMVGGEIRIRIRIRMCVKRVSLGHCRERERERECVWKRRMVMNE